MLNDFDGPERFLVDFAIEYEGISPQLVDQFTEVELTMGESLLTPGLQTTIRIHDYIQNLPVKNHEEFKGVNVKIKITKPQLEKYFDMSPTLYTEQTLYRLENRKFFNGIRNQEYLLRLCDPSMLNDATTLVSKSWKCATPSQVTSDVLSQCAGVRRMSVEPSQPARPYIAPNIHPFQVVAQQASVAWTGNMDPSFLHFMTFENISTHNFKSLYTMSRQRPVLPRPFHYQDIGLLAGNQDPLSALSLSFPCDFDLLSDALNGVGLNGADTNSMAVFNPVFKQFSLFGNQTLGCGIGSSVIKMSLSNSSSAAQQGTCPDWLQVSQQKRQARMSLLEQDKIALRMTVPWNPALHAGKVIALDLPNTNDTSGSTKNYGTGTYLILHMKHNIKRGGYATTTIDCVSTTVGRGEV